MLIRVGIALLILCGVALAQSPPNQPIIDQPSTQDSKEKTGEQQNKSQQQPITVNIVPAQKTETERAEEAADRRNKAETDAKLTEYTGQLADFTRGLFYATVVLGFATLGLLVIGILQSRDVKESVSAAKSAVIESKNANRISRDALVVENRAWLELDLRFEGAVRIENGLLTMTYYVTVKNFGKTPALNPRVSFDHILHPGDKDAEMARNVIEQSAVIAPFCPYIVRDETQTAPGYSGGKTIGSEPSDFGVPRIYACVRYRVIGSIEDHVTFRGFDLFARTPTGGGQFLRDSPNKSDIPLSVLKTGGGFIS